MSSGGKNAALEKEQFDFSAFNNALAEASVEPAQKSEDEYHETEETVAAKFKAARENGVRTLIVRINPDQRMTGTVTVASNKSLLEGSAKFIARCVFPSVPGAEQIKLGLTTSRASFVLCELDPLELSPHVQRLFHRVAGSSVKDAARAFSERFLFSYPANSFVEIDNFHADARKKMGTATSHSGNSVTVFNNIASKDKETLIIEKIQMYIVATKDTSQDRFASVCIGPAEEFAKFCNVKYDKWVKSIKNWDMYVINRVVTMRTMLNDDKTAPISMRMNLLSVWGVIHMLQSKFLPINHQLWCKSSSKDADNSLPQVWIPIEHNQEMFILRKMHKHALALVEQDEHARGATTAAAQVKQAVDRELKVALEKGLEVTSRTQADHRKQLHAILGEFFTSDPTNVSLKVAMEVVNGWSADAGYTAPPNFIAAVKKHAEGTKALMLQKRQLEQKLAEATKQIEQLRAVGRIETAARAMPPAASSAYSTVLPPASGVSRPATAITPAKPGSAASASAEDMHEDDL